MHLSCLKKPFIGVALLVCLLLSGCVEPHTSTRGTGQTRPAYCVSVSQLASRLGLSVGRGGQPHLELTNAHNTVRLFLYDNGRVYVNGQAVGTVGTVHRVGGEQYVSELLVPKIRGAMITRSAVPWTPPVVSIPRSGSGVVVIDPGHGGKDPGAQSALGYWEKEVNLSISRKLIGFLRDAGVTVHSTRDGDTYPTLEDRAALANRLDADLFVSIHCDSNGDRMHKGFTLYVARSASAESKRAGRSLERALSDTGIPSKGLRTANYKVLVQTRCPAVLVECGFMSNYDEAALLMDPWYQNKLARAIADGILAAL